MAKYDEWITEEGLIKIEGWARDGLTDEQIANNIGVNVRTIYDWKNKFSQFSHALKKGKDVVDRQVENAMFKSAIGYEYDEITKELNKDGELEVTKVVTKQVQPNSTAGIFWLKNRKPKEWRDKIETEHSGHISTGKLDSILEQLSDTDD
ncbi:helix-turn-helix domain-containing protein [Vagococcus carniphilus]|uniref:helix-turn-helix domain-containing protein n=1 Tax=Vagococcus carniphilus TaxID=218144 RepID=UPI0028920D83|nr:helix-turn-helix domain-containing protein [Vagococcus carniphilus]MDT2864678.1 helix-turn-helix domain-containing protein [Vagococcus carniphilus]